MRHTITMRSREIKLGPTAQKVVLLLLTGVALGLTRSPRHYFRILKDFQKAWSRIDQQKLHRAIKKLHRDHLITEIEKNGGTHIALSSRGEKHAEWYKIKNMKISEPPKWDKKWRIIIFDIPETQKKARDAFARILKNLGFYQLQKSVFAYPYECREELDFIAEYFEIGQYINFITAEKIEHESELKKYFNFP